MNIVILPRAVRDLDSVLGFIMLAGVAAAACAVVYFLACHHLRGGRPRNHRKR